MIHQSFGPSLSSQRPSRSLQSSSKSNSLLSRDALFPRTCSIRPHKPFRSLLIPLLLPPLTQHLHAINIALLTQILRRESVFLLWQLDIDVVAFPLLAIGVIVVVAYGEVFDIAVWECDGAADAAYCVLLGVAG